MTYNQFLKVIIVNAIIVVAFIIINLFRKKEKRRGMFLKALIMLLCPVVGPAFYFLSMLCYKYIFSTRADLSDVIFSKERVATNIKADVEREKNIVSLEEALAVTDKQNLRELMMSVVKRDVKQSLGTVAMALNSSDSETAHYAASVLQEELDNFRDDIRNRVDEFKKMEDGKAEFGVKLLDDLNFVLQQKVFTDMEQASYARTMDSIAEELYRIDQKRLSAPEFEAVCLRLLEADKFVRCEVWCKRSMEQYPYTLSSYTCFLKFYFKTGRKDEFFEMLDRLKGSNIIIDNETLELIRVFQR